MMQARGMDDTHDEHFQQYDEILRSGATTVVAHSVGAVAA
jgi:hypothetical protein